MNVWSICGFGGGMERQVYMFLSFGLLYFMLASLSRTYVFIQLLNAVAGGHEINVPFSHIKPCSVELFDF